jgi:hypothetical protein
MGRENLANTGVELRTVQPVASVCTACAVQAAIINAVNMDLECKFNDLLYLQMILLAVQNRLSSSSYLINSHNSVPITIEGKKNPAV